MQLCYAVSQFIHVEMLFKRKNLEKFLFAIDYYYEKPMISYPLRFVYVQINQLWWEEISY